MSGGPRHTAVPGRRHRYDLVEPGVQVPHLWRPELGDPVAGQEDGVIPGYGAVARKP
ncbi:hypothetical protein [Streptomyces sp. NPDC087460]|uniref:hypothetical protein n=1 Tax=Streptomyces sp. NPDC087460 TaxID=3365791 RepID=UPI0037F7BBE4